MLMFLCSRVSGQADICTADTNRVGSTDVLDRTNKGNFCERIVHTVKSVYSVL